MKTVIITFLLFFIAAILEIGGGYLIWLWLRHKGTILYGMFGALILFVYGMILPLQPATFGRTYAAYGGIFIVSSICWGMLVDKKRPDTYEVIGASIALLGACIIFYAPR